jgi:exopolysaccharide production protein ExoZ
MSEPVHARAGAVHRLHALDLCRGLCALGVAAYHLSLWGNTELSPLSRSLLALLGTYGVSVFFILSGYSLAHAYDRDFPGRIELGPLGAYIKRRIGRLAPLFVAVLVVSLAGKALLGGAKPIEPLTVLANATLLFGFADPAATPVIGGWSIGVEVVFYVVFPLLMVMRTRGAAMLAAAALLTAWVSVGLAQQPSLSDGWGRYVAPANHWIFFCAGAYARFHADRWRVGQAAALAFVAAALAVAAACVVGATELQLVTGWRRAVLVVLSIAVVAAIGRIAVASETMRSICTAMGGASYPLYLVHPLVFFALRGSVNESSMAWWLALIGVALVAAVLADRYVDSMIQRRMKRLGW